MNEMAFWKKYDIDPFMLALTLTPTLSRRDGGGAG